MLTSARAIVKQSNIVLLHCKLYNQWFKSLKSIIFSIKTFSLCFLKYAQRHWLA